MHPQRGQPGVSASMERAGSLNRYIMQLKCWSLNILTVLLPQRSIFRVLKSFWRKSTFSRRDFFIKEKKNQLQASWILFWDSPRQKPLHLVEGTPSEAQPLDLSGCRRSSGCRAVPITKLNHLLKHEKGDETNKEVNFLKETCFSARQNYPKTIHLCHSQETA